MIAGRTRVHSVRRFDKIKRLQRSLQTQSAENKGGKRVRLTEDVKRESDRRQTEAFEEAQRAEHDHIHGEGHGQTEHQHRQHRHQQHRDTAQPETKTQLENQRNITDASVCL